MMLGCLFEGSSSAFKKRLKRKSVLSGELRINQQCCESNRGSERTMCTSGEVVGNRLVGRSPRTSSLVYVSSSGLFEIING